MSTLKNIIRFLFLNNGGKNKYNNFSSGSEDLKTNKHLTELLETMRH